MFSDTTQNLYASGKVYTDVRSFLKDYPKLLPALATLILEPFGRQVATNINMVQWNKAIQVARRQILYVTNPQTPSILTMSFNPAFDRGQMDQQLTSIIGSQLPLGACTMYPPTSPNYLKRGTLTWYWELLGMFVLDMFGSNASFFSIPSIGFIKDMVASKNEGGMACGMSTPPPDAILQLARATRTQIMQAALLRLASFEFRQPSKYQIFQESFENTDTTTQLPLTNVSAPPVLSDPNSILGMIENIDPKYLYIGGGLLLLLILLRR